MRRALPFLLLISILFLNFPAAAYSADQNGFTKEDRPFISLSVKMEQIDKRFDDVNRRLSELR
ncbi:MAG: hypothetical protein ACUVQ6_08815, partial [Dissulfurimicrobium sp.]|uniref:hypothetical protein n=1 Tax=Dissulfurimicrobium sp. TaxID=2022436 RepID=UPI00404AE292